MKGSTSFPLPIVAVNTNDGLKAVQHYQAVTFLQSLFPVNLRSLVSMDPKGCAQKGQGRVHSPRRNSSLEFAPEDIPSTPGEAPPGTYSIHDLDEIPDSDAQGNVGGPFVGPGTFQSMDFGNQVGYHGNTDSSIAALPLTAQENDAFSMLMNEYQQQPLFKYDPPTEAIDPSQAENAIQMPFQASDFGFLPHLGEEPGYIPGNDADNLRHGHQTLSLESRHLHPEFARNPRLFNPEQPSLSDFLDSRRCLTLPQTSNLSHSRSFSGLSSTEKQPAPPRRTQSEHVYTSDVDQSQNKRKRSIASTEGCLPVPYSGSPPGGAEGSPASSFELVNGSEEHLPKRRRRLTPEGRDHAAKVRKARACGHCRSHKIRA